MGGGHWPRHPRRLSSLAVAAKRERTLEVVPDWLTGTTALRRAKACSGGGLAATVQTTCRPGVDGKRNTVHPRIPDCHWIEHVRSG